jgi:hypothetical protein
MYEETPIQPAYEPAPKKSNTGLIIGIVAAVILCCCCLIVVGGYAFYSVSSAVESTYSSIEIMLTPGAEGFEDFPVIPEIPEFPTDESGLPEIPAVPEIPYSYGDAIPQGGLGDDILRANTWGYVIITAAISGCTATDASKVVIEVLDQPDSAGAWREKWTVSCDGGSQKSFDVAFSPGAQGGTDIDVKASE